MNNVFYGKLDCDSIKRLEKNAKTPTPEEKKDEKQEENDNKLEDSKQKILERVLDNKDKGVDFFKKNKFHEAYVYFFRARKLMEKDFQLEINDKVPNLFDNYIKILRNEFWSVYNSGYIREADEKIDFLIKILGDDKRALEMLEIKAINYEKIDDKQKENLNLLKAEEIYKKLVQMDAVNNDNKIKYRNQIAIIQRKLLVNEPEYSKKLKAYENFEKQCESLHKDETKMLFFLKLILINFI